MSLSQRSVIVIGGLSRFGKSTACRRLLINGNYSARFVFDPKISELDRTRREYADHLSEPSARSLFDLSKAMVKGTVCFDPHPLSAELGLSLDKLCEDFCQWAYAKSEKMPGEKLVVVDDAHDYCTPNYLPDPMRKMVQSGATIGLNFLINCQEPHKLHSTIRNGMSEVILFRLQGEKPLKFAQENGFDPDEIANLPRFHWVARNLDSGGELRGVVEL